MLLFLYPQLRHETHTVFGNEDEDVDNDDENNYEDEEEIDNDDYNDEDFKIQDDSNLSLEFPMAERSEY